MGGRGRRATAARWALVAVVLVVLVVPGRLLAEQHEREDDALVPYRAQAAPDHPTARVSAGETWRTDAGVAAVAPRRIRVVEVRPRISVDTAQAVVTVQLCRRGATPALEAAGCRAVDTMRSARVRLQPGRARLVVSVTPRTAGTVLIEGYDVTYDDRGHLGTEHAGRALRVTATRCLGCPDDQPAGS